LAAETLDDLAHQAVRRCLDLARPPYSESAEELTRRYLTPAHMAAVDIVQRWMTNAGMAVRLDGLGTVIGRYAGSNPDLPPLIIGSHIDTVRNAGAFDGNLGVMLGIACVQALGQQGHRLPFALEIAAFGDEEGSRFPQAMLASRALAGSLAASALDGADGRGVRVCDALGAAGLPSRPDIASLKHPGAIGYFEAHIEQGPVLEAADQALGIVTAIAAQRRFACRFHGTAGHAGTTPMALRRDALTAAAEAILAIEAYCAAGPDGLVGTVGTITAEPGAPNVIPGEVFFTLDLRAPNNADRDEAADALRVVLRDIAEQRDIGFSIEDLHNLPACPSDDSLSDLLADAVRSVGGSGVRLMSGAGHDAMVMADLAPMAMLFIRCAGGVSHNPAESVEPADVALALQAMVSFLHRLGDQYGGRT
jgi:allantoate deiminase